MLNTSGLSRLLLPVGLSPLTIISSSYNPPGVRSVRLTCNCVVLIDIACPGPEGEKREYTISYCQSLYASAPEGEGEGEGEGGIGIQ